VDVSIAHVLQGETGGPQFCEWPAMVAAFYMILRGAGPWFGNAEPGLTARYVARYGHLLEDPTPGAMFMFSDADLELASVKAIVGNRKPLAIFLCKAGLALHVY